MKAYVASSYADRARSISLMRTLEARGIEVTSTWLRVVENDGTHDDRRRCADLDLADVERADIVIAHTLDAAAAPRGTLVEIGHGLALKKPVLWVGDPRERGGECIFFDATGVTRLHSLDALLVVLGEMLLNGVPAPRAGLVLPGWRCRWCGVFNSEEKELREDCRSCGRSR